MKKLLVSILGISALALSMASCGGSGNDDKVKVGFIFLHTDESTYDKNFIEAANEVVKELGLSKKQVIMKTNVPEGPECYETASDLVDQGCNIIFADSFGHEEHMVRAASENPTVQFCHATGVKAHTENLDNYHNAFASIYEGRYLAGIAAGMKLNEMISNEQITAEQAVMGYVGAFPYAEVVSGYTSFYLGAKSVCPSVTMNVRYTNSWYDVARENAAAKALIENDNCVLISQHADSQGAPSVCEEKNVPNVFYNGTNLDKNTYLCASKIDWRPYFRYMLNCVINGDAIATDWTGTLENGAVKVLDLGTCAASGTAEAIEAAKAKLLDGSLKVFDTTKFTVGGQALSTYMANVDDDPAYAGDTEAIVGGYFHESEHRSAPYFDLRIDGITEINDSLED